jgi:cytoskeletal protein CcmA (bactofilin family)
MWEKKDADQQNRPTAPGSPAPRTAAAPDYQTTARSGQAKIGQSLFIKGEVSGSEDLTVEGRVEGRIDLKDHNLTIGQNGRVTAEIHAKNITIVGEVTGNVVADERVDLTDTAKLLGDIRAPRISVSDGAKFKGSVDMVQEGGQEKSQQQQQQKQKNPSAQAVQVETARSY